MVRATRDIIQQSLDDFVGFVIDVINLLEGHRVEVHDESYKAPVS